MIESWDRGDGPREGFYTKDVENGVYFLRVNNLKSYSISLTDVKYINRIVHETTLKRTQVTAGDLVFAISGTKDNLGTVSIIPENIKEANLNSALVRLNLDETRIRKKFFCIFFDLRITRTQIDYIGKGAAQNNLNNSEISEILLPLPSLDEQDNIVELFEKAMSARRQKEQEAERLLESIDSVVLKALGINLPAEDKGGLEDRKFFRSFRELYATRLDPFPYQKRRMQAIQAIDEAHLPKKRLLDIFLFRKEVVTQAEGLPYVGLENIRSNTGEYVGSDSEKETFNSALRFYKGDILFPKLRPYLNKVHLASFDGVCSTEFYVLTEAKGLEEYLAACFRSRLIVNQTSCLMTGNTLPRLQTSDVENLLIPLPDETVQKSIGEEVRDIQKQVNQIREEANQTVSQAKQEVERMILGDVA